MKNLFFTALMAVVAVGGAFASKYYAIGQSTNPYICPAGIVSCEAKYQEDGNEIVSSYKYSDNRNQPSQQLFSTIPWDGLN